MNYFNPITEKEEGVRLRRFFFGFSCFFCLTRPLNGASWPPGATPAFGPWPWNCRRAGWPRFGRRARLDRPGARRRRHFKGLGEARG